jgi:hypothetical protein
MGSLVLAGATSGSTTIQPTDAVTATVTLPSTGGTLQTSGAGFTTNGVAYATSTSALATGSGLVFNGTNLGVGTTSAQSKLTVAGTSPAASSPATYPGTIQINETALSTLQATGGLEFRGAVFGSGYGSKITGSDTGDLLFGSRSNSASWTETMRLDANGNLGLNITPSAWSTQFNAIQTGFYASFGQRINSTGDLFTSWNAYNDTTGTSAETGWKYNDTGDAVSLMLQNGRFQWFSAPSGTVGGAISFTNIANLDRDSLYVYVGVNPSSNGSVNARIFTSSSGSGTSTLYVGNQTINTSSDIRLKENVVDTQRNALELLGQLRVVDHTWNDPSDQCENNRNSRGLWMGLIAQEAQPIIPWLVNKPTADVDEKGDPQYWHMDYGYSVPLLVKAIQELSALVTAQSATITSLTERITALEGK